jgi:hypothetical protein
LRLKPKGTPFDLKLNIDQKSATQDAIKEEAWRSDSKNY